MVPRVKTVLGKSSLKFTGAMEWNKLPSSIQEITSHSHFKKCLKSHLLNEILVEEHNAFVS